MKTILELLQIAKENKLNGYYIEIALGKYKLPQNIKEGYQMLKQELWLRK
tara:strand:- start:283 stop:432 length:150 start_codon:yes stop_codon:yes gene_type:complete